MRAAVVERYGPPEVATVRDRPAPVPGRGEVLVRVAAAAVTSGDARMRAARFPAGFTVPGRLALGLRGPRAQVLGGAFAGTVEEVGPGADGVLPGLAQGDLVCGMNGARLGAHAELVAVRASRLARVPAGVGADDAAGVLFGGTTALHVLERTRVGPGDSVLVVGAAGAVGTNAVQLARLLGATVTAVCSGRNAELVRGLGATAVVDRTREEPAGRWDVVVDTVGALSIAGGRALLHPGGRLALVAATLAETLRARGDVVAGPAPERVEVFDRLLALVAEGTLRVVHDRAYPLEEIVAAYRHVDTGHKVGNVLVHP